MYDELVRRLREDVPKALSNFDYDFVEDWIKVKGSIKAAADAIDELSKREADMSHNMTALSLRVLRAEEKIPRWIPVTERLPEAGERVLCYCRVNIYEVMKMRTDGDWVYDTNHVYLRSFVIQWMPLPQPPKEE